MRPYFFPLQRLSGTALVAALVLMATPALAQTAAPGTLQPRVAAPAEPPTYTLIHVNASSGSDTSGDGSQLRPYQTITHALGVATANSIVLLAPGDYSEASGERFPIQLRTGVTVQGSPNSALGQTVIRGSGIFASATAGMVQTTLVGADGAGLGHVTVTNTSTAGYGLVIEVGRPAVRHNQFVDSGYGGVYVAGNSAPLLEGNQFSRNGVVGLVLEGQTAAEVRGNRFEQTGIGIRVAPGARPQIIQNTIVQNQEGLLLDGSANPVLQDNVIAQNRRNGVVEFQTALKADEASQEAMLPAVAVVPSVLSTQEGPTVALASPVIATPPVMPAPPAEPVALGTPVITEPVVSAPPVMPAPPAEPVALGTSVAPMAQSAPMVQSLQGDSAASTAPADLGVAADTENPAPATATPAVSPAQPSDTVLTARESLRRWRLAESQGASSPTATNATSIGNPPTENPPAENLANSEAISIAVIPPPVNTVARANAVPSRPAVPSAPIQSAPIQAVAPAASPSRPAQSSATASPVSIPTNPDVLPVPDRQIPIGSGGSAVSNLAPPTTTLALNGMPPAPPSHRGLLGLVYTVVVPAADAATQAQVRAAVADAFRVNLNGQPMMQVGAYADQATAEARANELMAQGFEARVEYRP